MKKLFIRFVRLLGRGLRPVILVSGMLLGFANAVVDAPPAAAVAVPATAKIMSAPAATVAVPAAAKMMSTPGAAAPAAAGTTAQQIKSAPAVAVNEPAAATQSEPPGAAGEKVSANEPEAAAQRKSSLREFSYAGREFTRLGAKLLHESGLHVFLGVIFQNLGWSFAWSFAYVALGFLIAAMLLRSAAQFFGRLLEGGPAPAI